MSLEILIILGALAMAGLAGVYRISGLSEPRRIRSAAEAKTLWEESYPEWPATHAMLSVTGEAALVRHAGGHGLLWAIGHDVAARRITPGAVRLRETDRHLILKTTDYTAPRIRLALSADERPIWRATLEDPTPKS